MHFGQDSGSVPQLMAEEETILLENLNIFIEGFRYLENNEFKLFGGETETDRLFWIKKIRDSLHVWKRQGLDVSWIEEHSSLFLEALNLYLHYKKPKGKKMLFRRIRGILCKFQEKEAV